MIVDAAQIVGVMVASFGAFFPVLRRPRCGAVVVICARPPRVVSLFAPVPALRGSFNIRFFSRAGCPFGPGRRLALLAGPLAAAVSLGASFLALPGVCPSRAGVGGPARRVCLGPPSGGGFVLRGVPGPVFAPSPRPCALSGFAVLGFLVWARAGVPSPPSARGWAGARQVASPPAPGRRPSLRCPVLRGGSSSVSPFPPWRVAPEGAAPPSGAWGGGLVSCGAGAGCAALWGRRSRLLAPLVLPPRLLACVGRWARPWGCGGLWPRGEQGRGAGVVHSLSPSGYRRGTNIQPSPVKSMPCNSRRRSLCTRSRI